MDLLDWLRTPCIYTIRKLLISGHPGVVIPVLRRLEIGEFRIGLRAMSGYISMVLEGYEKESDCPDVLYCDTRYGFCIYMGDPEDNQNSDCLTKSNPNANPDIKIVSQQSIAGLLNFYNTFS